MTPPLGLPLPILGGLRLPLPNQFLEEGISRKGAHHNPTPITPQHNEYLEPSRRRAHVSDSSRPPPDPQSPPLELPPHHPFLDHSALSARGSTIFEVGKLFVECRAGTSCERLRAGLSNPLIANYKGCGAHRQYVWAIPHAAVMTIAL